MRRTLKHFWLPVPPESEPRRIVSLVPGLTELYVRACGPETTVVGRTRYCTEPEQLVSRIPVVGGTKDPAIDDVIRLAPDLVIASREENRREDVEAIADAAPVLVSDICNLDDLCDLLHLSAQTFPSSARRFQALNKLINDAIAACRALSPSRPIPVAYLIWRNPWMVAGGDTFIHSVLDTVGYRNVFAQRPRYPAVTAEELRTSGARLLLLSSEPFPFTAAHARELEDATGLPTAPINGRDASWYSASTPAALLALLRQRLELGGDG
ncbi:MAG: cobalamin-binding protein [Candidatus Dadabacteria bacterium]|nr:MAG: cobalamin-binding protein [Candidatus Dadabacteria bacterium]